MTMMLACKTWNACQILEKDKYTYINLIKTKDLPLIIEKTIYKYYAYYQKPNKYYAYCRKPNKTLTFLTIHKIEI